MVVVGVTATILFVVIMLNMTTRATPVVIVSKEQAIDLALTAANNDPQRNATVLPRVDTNALLLYITNDGSSFVIDDKSFETVRPYAGKHGFGVELYNHHVWYVFIDTFDGKQHYLGYVYSIDVLDGQILFRDYILKNVRYN